MKLFIHSQTSTAAPLKFGIDKWFHPTLYKGSNYLSLLGLQLIQISKSGPWRKRIKWLGVRPLQSNAKYDELCAWWDALWMPDAWWDALWMPDAWWDALWMPDAWWDALWMSDAWWDALWMPDVWWDALWMPDAWWDALWMHGGTRCECRMHGGMSCECRMHGGMRCECRISKCIHIFRKCVEMITNIYGN